MLSNKYHRVIYGIKGGTCVIDVYRVLDAFSVQDPGLQHLIKKALCSGLRGHKDQLQDLLDIKESIEASILLHQDKKAYALDQEGHTDDKKGDEQL